MALYSREQPGLEPKKAQMARDAVGALEPGYGISLPWVDDGQVYLKVEAPNQRLMRSSNYQ